jgi:hypothetical protein
MSGHTDAPPDVPMLMRWGNNIGSQIGHFYLNAEGLLTHNDDGVRGLGTASRRFERGQRFDTIDRLGRIAFSQTITASGGFIVTGPKGRSCSLTPEDTGFQFSVSIDCGQLGKTHVFVSDDLATGVLTIETGSLREAVRYDIATGELVSHHDPPRLLSSAENPE